MRSRSTGLAEFPLIPAESAGAPLEAEVVAHFDRLREPLLRYLLTFGLEISDSEEVVQEVFLALFQHLQRQGSRANLRAWLFRVAHNLGLRRRYQTLRVMGEPLEQAGGDWLPDPAPGPEEQLLSMERQRRMLAVLRVLPEQDRRCLTLRAEGLRYREIAQVLAMSLGSVSLSLARSLARIERAAER